MEDECDFASTSARLQRMEGELSVIEMASKVSNGAVARVSKIVTMLVIDIFKKTAGEKLDEGLINKLRSEVLYGFSGPETLPLHSMTKSLLVLVEEVQDRITNAARDAPVLDVLANVAVPLAPTTNVPSSQPTPSGNAGEGSAPPIVKEEPLDAFISPVKRAIDETSGVGAIEGSRENERGTKSTLESACSESAISNTVTRKRPRKIKTRLSDSPSIDDKETRRTLAEERGFCSQEALSCPICRKDFSTFASCHEHITKNHGSEVGDKQLYGCTGCTNRWKSPQGMFNHLILKNCPGSFVRHPLEGTSRKDMEEEEERTEKENVKKEVKEEEEEQSSESLICPYCQKNFTSEVDMMIHGEEAHKGSWICKSFECRECPEKTVFKTMKSFTRHWESTHTTSG